MFWGEDKVKRRLSNAELVASRVARRPGPCGRRASGAATASPAYMPNMPEAIIAMLAAASLGAIWSSARPDFGVQGVLDRFGQIEPKLLFTVDGYWYNGKPQPVLDKLAAIVKRLPTLRRVVVTPYLREAVSSADLSAGCPRDSVGRLRRALRAGRAGRSSACRSSIRSTSCIPRARRACRNASCTAPAARCSSI